MSTTRMPPPTGSDEFDLIADETTQLEMRRARMYTPEALENAREVDDIFVMHPAFKEALGAFDRCFQLAKTLTVPNGVLITGPTGSGKTSLIEHFWRTLPGDTLYDQGFGALAIRLPFRPTAGQIISALLRKLRYPFAEVTNRSVYVKREVAFDALRQKKCRMIFIDEGHHLANQVRHQDRQGFDTAASELLRELMDEVKINLVIAADAQPEVLDHIDPALASRVSVRLALRNFELKSTWFAYIKAFCRQASGVDFGYLTTPEAGQQLHAGTLGNLRAFKRLVTEAALIGIDAQKSTVDASIMALAFERVNGTACAITNPYALRT